MEQVRSAVQIRMALKVDAAAVASVLAAAFVEYRLSYTQEGFAATALSRDKIEIRMNEGPMWVALYDEAIVGAVAAVSKGAALYVRGMGIVPAARGKGIGELLLEHVENLACAQSYKRMILSTTPFLIRAIKLYEQFGFVRSSEGPFDLFGTPLFTMVKDLT